LKPQFLFRDHLSSREISFLFFGLMVVQSLLHLLPFPFILRFFFFFATWAHNTPFNHLGFPPTLNQSFLVFFFQSNVVSLRDLRPFPFLLVPRWQYMFPSPLVRYPQEQSLHPQHLRKLHASTMLSTFLFSPLFRRWSLYFP